MKNSILFSFLLMLGTMASYAQSAPLNINNNGNCSQVVTAYAVDPATCQLMCKVQHCMGQYTSISIPPCGPANWEWDFVVVEPAIDACDVCGPATIVGSPIGCTGFPSMIFGIPHCAGCGPFDLMFNSPNDLDIN